MKKTDTLQKTLLAIRRTIHQHPELGNKEFKTSALVRSVLRAAGVSARSIAGTGVVGIINGGRGPGKTLALRADLDALPIQEQTGKPYASRCAGVMHACGHDANTAIVLGAALELSRQKKMFAGTVKLLFQPNEESSGGAKKMIAAGALKNPAVDAILGVHVSPWLKAGTLGVKHGEMMAAVDRFVIEIEGEGGHGAYPHLSVDAVVVAAQVVSALQTVVARQISPVDPVVLTIGTIAGGQRYNIICDRVRMEGTVRTLNEDVRARVRKLIERHLKQVTAAFGARYTLEYENLGKALINDEQLVNLCRRSGEELLGAARVKVLDKPSMGGEDFSEYLQKVPGCFLYFGTAPRVPFPWHHAQFDIDESVLARGARLLAGTALRYLEQGGRRA